MSTNNLQRFKLPVDLKNIKLPADADKVCVVSVLGKSRRNIHQSKASILNCLVNKDIFQNPNHDEAKTENELIDIEGHYDAENKLMLLHLSSCYDTTTMSEMCHRATEQISQMGYHSFLQSTEYQFTKAVLYLFSISHILLIVHPGNSFDMTYVRLFRVLDTIRLKLQSHVGECLRGGGAGKDWVSAGRLCSPRVLFIFERSTLTSSELNDAVVMSKTRSQKTPPIKRLQHAIEDQIYRILRKSRVITNISNNSLFAVPANQEFVHVFAERSPHQDPVSYYISQLQTCCITAKDSDTPRSRSYQTNRRVNQTSSASSSETNRAVTSAATTPTDQNSFKAFLMQHIELALSKGFDDNVGRNPVQAVFEAPALETWLEVSNKLFTFFLLDQPEARSRSSFSTLKSMMEIDGRFSEIRCAKIVPMAESAYREGLPHYYTSSYHQDKLVQAEQVFRQHARGPAADKYLRQLADECEKVWRNGRQQCEETSLTGKPCVNQLHRVPEIPEIDSNAGLPAMSHSSQVKTKAACNCGFHQAERDDPFDHRSANYDFYQKLSSQCSQKLDRYYDLPVFQPSTSNVKAGTPKMITVTELEEQLEHAVDIRKDSMAPSMSGLSFALSLGQSGASDTFSHKTHDSYNAEDASITVGIEADDMEPGGIEGEGLEPEGLETEGLETEGLEGEHSPQAPLSPLRQVSTTEYLPGMIHSDSPSELLPKFPSWSLLSLGKYSLYSPGQGVDQPGFLHGCNFLLPYDQNVHISDHNKWPSISEAGKKGKPRKPQRFDREKNELSIRLYLGYEYECPRGHRFFMSSPYKVFKAPTTGAFKEMGNDVVNNDMPLYYPCHCRSSKGYIGQLMRIYVTIPDGPFVVRLAPRVCPHAGHDPLFYPSPDGALTLKTGYWVLRLPYVYLGESGPYVMPTDHHALPSCRILKGVFSIHEDT